MSHFHGLKHKFMTEQGLDIMKGHWLKVIRVRTVGFLASVATDAGSCLISNRKYECGIRSRTSEGLCDAQFLEDLLGSPCRFI